MRDAGDATGNAQSTLQPTAALLGHMDGEHTFTGWRYGFRDDTRVLLWYKYRRPTSNTRRPRFPTITILAQKLGSHAFQAIQAVWLALITLQSADPTKIL